MQKKRKQLLEGEDELWSSVNKRKKYSKVTPELIQHLNERIGNHPQVVNLPISNDMLLLPDTLRPGKKIRISKLLLLIPIFELHNDLISEGNIYQLKEAIDDKTGNPLINDTSLRVLMPNNGRKMTDRYKHMCGF